MINHSEYMRLNFTRSSILLSLIEHLSFDHGNFCFFINLWQNVMYLKKFVDIFLSWKWAPFK